MFKNKKVLVTGGTGMIGIQLVGILYKMGAKVRVVSMEKNKDLPEDVEFKKLNLTSYDNCIKACRGIDYVFHLAGIKVSAGIATKRVASIFVPGILFNTNMMEAARISGVKRYLYTSSVGVYGPAKIFHEDDVWHAFPSPKDWFGGWAKRVGELQVEAYKIEFGWDKTTIVRPANTYGPYDNFDPKNAMVIPSLIRRVLGGENPLVVWGDGSEIRDFVFSRDIARGMILAMKHADGSALNLGSGTGVTIKELVNTICESVEKPPRVVWDKSKKSGDKMRIMDIKKAQSIGYDPKTALKEGIKETIEWFLKNRKTIDKKYNVFYAKKFV